jgi:hypothetical protein
LPSYCSRSLLHLESLKSGGIPEDRAYGFPQFFVREWSGGAVRTGMFDFQNGMFFEFDGQKIYAVRRSSTQQMAGTVSALQGSEVIFGTGTSFQAQLEVWRLCCYAWSVISCNSD